MNHELKVGLEQIVGMPFIYGYFVVAFLIGLYLVFNSNTKNKFEIFALAFYLMTGNLNKLLTFAIPGVSFFEIQPERFLLITFLFYLFRRALFSDQAFLPKKFWVMPWFVLMLIIYAFFKISALYSHSNTIQATEIIIKSLHVINVLVIILSLRLMYTPELIKILGKAILIGAIVTCIVSFIQIGVDPMFARTGDIRTAFGDVIRANGIFNAEYNSSYYLIVATTLVLGFINNSWLKYALITLFVAGIFLTFHRMSWLALLMVLTIHFLFFAKPVFDKLLLIGLAGVATLLIVFMVNQRDIVNSTLVKERVTDKVDSRFGYYNMVFDNIGKNPILGYGNNENEVYYYSMLRITRMRNRATGETGGIHNGYLSVMFFYGIPAFILFTLFIASSVVYFWSLFLRTHNVIFSIAFFLSLVYGLSNITNSLLFSEYFGFLFSIILGLGLGARYYLNLSHPTPLSAPTTHSLEKTNRL